ncbi:MAG TPA: hypothetical protein VMT53_09625 [Terriglobales bacterium]|nr:hypothetical protein [Terriglobales bacterium]
MLRKYVIVSACCALLYAAPIFVAAQDTGNAAQSPTATQPESGRQRAHFDPAKRTEKLTRNLNLNADQQAKVNDILTSEQSQMQSLHSDTSMAQADRRAKMMDIRKSSDDQIRALLDPTQQQKWDKMEAKREKRMEKHHRGNPTTRSAQQQ